MQDDRYQGEATMPTYSRIAVILVPHALGKIAKHMTREQARAAARDLRSSKGLGEVGDVEYLAHIAEGLEDLTEETTS